MTENDPSSSPPSFARAALDTFELGADASDPIRIGGSGSTIENIIEFFEEETAARLVSQALKRDESQALKRDEIVPRLKAALREQKSFLRRMVAFDLAWLLFATYATRFSEAYREEDWAPFENARLAGEGESLTEEALRGAGVAQWGEAPPAPLRSIAGDLLQQDSWTAWAEHCAESALQWAAWNFQQFHDPPPAGEDWKAQFREKIEAGELLEPVTVLSKAIAKAAVDRLNESAERGGLTPLQIERLWGLHDEDEVPTPRPETPEMARNPFQGNSGQIAALPSGPFVRTATKALLNAREVPGETYARNWGQDGTGNPVYVDTLGDPYDGKAIFTVKGVGNARPAEINAGLGWAMLKEIGPDAVWTHALLLAHASDPGRRGERSPMCIPRDRFERAHGLHNSNAYSARERYERVKQTLEALGSIFVKFQNVRRHGENLHFRGAATASPLWNLSLEVYGQADLFDGAGKANWHVEAVEGIWADKFLHDNDSPQWTWLPVEWFDKIDRRRTDYAQRLAVYLLFLFRAQDNKGHRVRLSAESMLEICNVDLARDRQSSQRTGLKNKLLGALNRLDEAYGIAVNDEEVNVKYIPWEDWKGRVAYFDPPEVIEPALFKGEKPDPKPLPNPGGDWTSSQIRVLRNRLSMTQAELGDVLDVSRHYVSMLENAHRNPSPKIRKTLDKLKARGR